MAKSIIRFICVIPAVIFIGYLVSQLMKPSGLTVNHWILPTEFYYFINELAKGEWHQAWRHLSRTLSIQGHILVTLFLLAIFGIRHYFSATKKQTIAADHKVESLHRKATRLGEMGLSCSESGQIPKAIDYYAKSLAISRQIGDHHVVGTTLGNMGNAYLTLGRTNEAIAYHEQALEIFRQIGYRHGEGSVLSNLGRTYIACGQVEKAIMYNKQSLSIFEETNSPYASQMRKWVSELENRGKRTRGHIGSH